MKTRELTRVAMYTAITCCAAVIFRYVPETIVPYSILPLLVLLAGFVLGPKLGAWSMALYVLIGLLGVQVFATPPFGGLTYVIKPTFGYMIGYIVAAYAVGKLLALKQRPGFVWSYFAVIVGIVCIYVFGLAYMYLIINLVVHQAQTVWQIVKLGFIPFIVLDLIKGFVAVILGQILNKTITPIAR
ncbi:MAG: biotin transporter BioY [Peptococcaceae bacterium]|nr:biotin transporter BioY [Peptococcaceae bacterium]